MSLGGGGLCSGRCQDSAPSELLLPEVFLMSWRSGETKLEYRSVVLGSKEFHS